MGRYKKLAVDDHESSGSVDSEPTVIISRVEENGNSPKLNYGTLTPPLKQRRKLPTRTISKDGECAFIAENIDSQNWKFIQDGFTSLLEVRWRYALLAFCCVYLLSWIFFAVLWYGVCYLNGDLENYNNTLWNPCVSNIDGFTAAFMFSVETQQTVGYGYYHIEPNCLEAITILCVQSVFGVLLEGILVGILFVKMSRAKKRSATLLFSKTGVISMRDGFLYLMIRVGDMRTKSHLLEAHVRAVFISKRTTREGEVIKYHQQELEVGGEGEKYHRVFLFWPTVLLHQIDENSPLYNVSPQDLTDDNNSFEIIVILEGINENTGLSAQARTSYLPSEIIWGHRFKDLHRFKNDAGAPIVDYALFHNTYSVKTPFVSAAELSKNGTYEYEYGN